MARLPILVSIAKAYNAVAVAPIATRVTKVWPRIPMSAVIMMFRMIAVTMVVAPPTLPVRPMVVSVVVPVMTMITYLMGCFVTAVFEIPGLRHSRRGRTNRDQYYCA